jgi:hypothetical protein
MTPRVRATKVEIDKSSSSKLKTFVHQQGGSQSMEWEKYLQVIYLKKG